VITPADIPAQVVCELESSHNQQPNGGYGGDELRIHLPPSSFLLSDEMPGVEAVISMAIDLAEVVMVATKLVVARVG
jgi:hypothetical protein